MALDLSGKKEDDVNIVDNVTHQKQDGNLSLKSKPLTELSKKAEEEVNHLSRNPTENERKINNTNSSFSNDNTNNQGSSTFLRRINETLQVLDKSTEVKTRSTLTESSKRFLNRLQNQIKSMSPPEATAVEEQGTYYPSRHRITKRRLKNVLRDFLLSLLS